jgi:hypothetical protein
VEYEAGHTRSQRCATYSTTGRGAPLGHTRLGIPLGKGHTEPVIPLRPDAAADLEEVTAGAKAQNRCRAAS